LRLSLSNEELETVLFPKKNGTLFGIIHTSLFTVAINASSESRSSSSSVLPLETK